MKRALDAVLAAPAAAAFVACVELLLMRSRRGRSRIEKVLVPAPARLRVRRGTDGARVTFAIEGVLDDFSARLLACAVLQAPPGATVVFDLSVAGPIRDNPVGLLASACISGRQVQLRGLNEGHAGLLERLRERGVPTAVIECSCDGARVLAGAAARLEQPPRVKDSRTFPADSRRIVSAARAAASTGRRLARCAKPRGLRGGSTVEIEESQSLVRAAARANWHDP